MATVYTQADLAAVTAAIIALATGSRVASVTFAPAGQATRTVQYVASDLGELRALQAEIQREVNGSPTFRLATFAKGFDSGSSSSDD